MQNHIFKKKKSFCSLFYFYNSFPVTGKKRNTNGIYWVFYLFIIFSCTYLYHLCLRKQTLQFGFNGKFPLFRRTSIFAIPFFLFISRVIKIFIINSIHLICSIVCYSADSYILRIILFYRYDFFHVASNLLDSFICCS
jgi:uncharacterized membrane protein